MGWVSDASGRLAVATGLCVAIIAPIAGAASTAPEAPFPERPGAAWALATIPALMAEIPSPVRLVCIDPGHGGAAEGAVGHLGLVEKDLALDVSRRLGRILEAELGYAVIYTRDDDSDIDLGRRPAIANEVGADLFISVHANAASTPKAAGFETFFLSPGSGDKAAGRLAARENRVAAAGVRSGAGVAGTSPLGMILADLAIREAHENSSHLAGSIHGALVDALDGLDRGVKQAPFLVLAGALMPAVLVEMGFVTSRPESRLLARSEYRERIARAIADGVARFDGLMSRKMAKAPLAER